MRIGALSKASLALVLLVASFAVALIAADLIEPLRATEPVAGIPPAADGWVEAASWDFACGAHPGGWGWGDWRVEDGALKLTDLAGTSATYFLPIEHGGSFRLEAEVQFVSGAGDRPAGAHLGTERRNPDTRTETGLFVFTGNPEAADDGEPRGKYAHLRHFVGQAKLLEPAEAFDGIEYGTWHELGIEIVPGRITASLDGRPVEAFETMADHGAGERAKEPQPLAGPYHAPHLGVEDGIALFRRLRVLEPATTPPTAATDAGPAPPPPAPPAAVEPAPAAAAPGPEELSAAITAWARARSERRFDDSQAFYGSCFVPPGGRSRPAWRDLERHALAGDPARRLEPGELEPRLLDPARAEVDFVDTADGEPVTKTVVWGVEDGRWRIVAERAAVLDEERPRTSGWVRAMLWALYAVVFLICVYMLRHYVFTLNRLLARQRHPYLDIDVAEWPRATVLIPAHNEEAVIGDILSALLEVDYPQDRLRIMPIDDRSEDRTGEIIDDFAIRHPDRVTPLHRNSGKPGKAAALQDAMRRVDDDILLVFDADYVPGRGLIKQLVAPFFDPEVGAVMGRVVPFNVARNLLTRLLDLERAGGYQVDQQARMNLRLVAQYGGTAGAVRRSALLSVGGWQLDSLTEDTDATLRLLLAGWKTVYENRSECYEQVPESWGARIRQILRWARGHNQVMARYGHRLLFNRQTSLREKLDGLLLLHIYAMSVVLLLGWALGTVLWFLGVFKPSLILILLVVSYSTLGNFAAFFEIAAATYLDGSRKRILLLPFVFGGFLVSVLAVGWATLSQPFYRPGNNGELLWHKTEHKRGATAWT